MLVKRTKEWSLPITESARFIRATHVEVAQQILSVLEFVVVCKLLMSIGLLFILPFDPILQLSTFAKVSDI